LLRFCLVPDREPRAEPDPDRSWRTRLSQHLERPGPQRHIRPDLSRVPRARSSVYSPN